MVNFVICIRIKETLSDDWSQWFDGLSITPDEGGRTILIGTLPDQPALRGILCKFWDLNLTILSCSFSDSPDQIRQDKFDALRAWLAEKVHQHGS